VRGATRRAVANPRLTAESALDIKADLAPVTY
jgi:hypothetical protein